MSDELIAEAEELIESLSRGLALYEKAVNSGRKIDPSLVNNIFRSAHTLKGVVGLAGLQEMGKLTHSLETLLDQLRLNKMKATPAILDLLFETVGLLESLLQRNSNSSSRVEGIMQKLENIAEGKTANKRPDKTPESLKLPQDIRAALTEYDESRLEANLKENKNIVIVMAKFSVSDFDKKLPQTIKALAGYGEVIATIPIADKADQNKMIFKLVYATQVRMEKLKSVFQQKGYGLLIIKQVK